jgi:uncharacterized protein
LRAVVDTNIFAAALLSAQGPNAQVVRAVEEGKILLVTSEPLLLEIEGLLGRAKIRQRGVSAATAASFRELLRRVSVIVPIQGNLKLCRDPKDNMLIETAIRGSADVLASNDNDLHAREVVDHLAPWGIRVLNVYELLRELSSGPPAEHAAEEESDDGTS